MFLGRKAAQPCAWGGEAGQGLLGELTPSC